MKNIVPSTKLMKKLRTNFLRWIVRKCGVRNSEMQNNTNKQSNIHFLFPFNLLIMNFVIEIQYECTVFKLRYHQREPQLQRNIPRGCKRIN
ncbi:hypothetical protein E0L14_06530 [Bacteroides fragilis]|nr:hypothetical protein E0L14_06530 [Bacteroides fragilis]